MNTDSLLRVFRSGSTQDSVMALACVVAEAGSPCHPSEVSRGVWVIDQDLVLGVGTSRRAGIHVSVVGVDTESDISVVADTVRRECRDALCLCLLPTCDGGIWPIGGTEREPDAAAVIPIYATDLEVLLAHRDPSSATREVDLLELVGYKLYRRLIQEKPDPETQYDSLIMAEHRASQGSSRAGRLQSLSSVLSDLREDRNEWVDHPLVQEVSQRVIDSGGCLLAGKSSSGKTVLALQVGLNLHRAGVRVEYLNVGMSLNPPPLFLQSLISGGTSNERQLIILDDLQGSPATARYVLAVSGLARRASAACPPPAIMAVTWKDFAEEARLWHGQSLYSFSVGSQQVAPRLAQKYEDALGEEDLGALNERLGDDLALFRLSLERGKELGACPSLSQVAEAFWRSRTIGAGVATEAAERVALVVGSLGRYGMSAPEAFVRQEARVSGETVPRLVRTRLLRRDGVKLTMGHRSLCGLLVDWLEGQGAWKATVLREGSGDPGAQVVLRYLKSLEPSLALDTLRGLQTTVGFKESLQLNQGASALVGIWLAFNAVTERIEQQQAKDPLWGNVPSSAMFAVRAMHEIGKPDLAEASLEFLRSHWRIDADGHFSVDTEGLSTVLDFAQIRLKMLEEDTVNGAQSWPGFSPASDVDMDRFHRTWLMGIFLSAEQAAAKHPVPLDELAQAVEANQLPSGAFYLERVPWCTARVLLGLASCGRTVDTSKAVRRACEWLLTDREDGGASRDGIWQSGTGVWNSELETTSMVLLALAKAGHDCRDERLGPAKAFVLSEKSRWTAPGRELDGALAAEAYLATGGRWDEVRKQTQQLSEWARGEALWQQATMSSEHTFQQSCRVAQIASHLISIGWTGVRDNLPLFLSSLATPRTLSPEDAEAVFEAVQAVSSLSLSACRVVGEYYRYDDQTRNRLVDWCGRIEYSLANKSRTHENYLMWAAPGTGKTTLVRELAKNARSRPEFLEVNLAETSRDQFSAVSQNVSGTSDAPLLCFLDEIDARPDETWVYDSCLAMAELNTRFERRPVVVVMAGSSSDDLKGMVRSISGRHKGADLLDRVPEAKRFDIPRLSLRDRMAVFGGQVWDAARERGLPTFEIEKVVLFYVMMNSKLRSPRQTADFARSAVARLASGETRLMYDDLFERGDTAGKRSWARHEAACGKLSDVYVSVVGRAQDR